jgi:putative cardiolipin synthase
MRCLVFLIIFFSSCTSLHKVERVASQHIQSKTDTILFQRLAPMLKSHADKTGIIPLKNGKDALVSRIWSIQQAQHAIDLQYYIWKDDFSGLLVLNELLIAASRGVHIRLLLDNLNSSRFLNGLKIIDKNPNIEVRLINTSFKNLNRRMHNKSFTVDNQLGILGGRNIGDEYFDIDQELNFKDYDVLAIGPFVEEISVQFDEYWNSNTSFPVSEIQKKALAERDVEKTQLRMEEAKKYSIQVTDPFNKFNPFWGDAHLVFDSPEKLEGENKENLSMQLRPVINQIKKDLFLVTPYFIPGDRGMETFKRLRNEKVRIVVLTNSLLSTDVLAVHGGYKKYRVDLLKMGIELYELKSSGKNKKLSVVGSSGSIGLHGKIMIGDRKNIFVSSMNLDPRSIDLNTELGVIISDSEMANDQAEKLLKSLPEVAYRLELDNEKIKWKETTEKGEIVHVSEPGANLWKSIRTEILSWFIPEEML